MKKLVLAIIAATVLIFNTTAAFAQTLNIDALSYILIDSKSGQVLIEHNSLMQGLYPASTTKIMTAILAIEKGTPDQMMTASAAAINDIGKDGMNIGIMAGEQLSMENLLHALLVSSANETANIIAENISPTRQEFVDLMNEKARELGAENTHFVNPCGSHNDNHYTTAADFAKIARHAMTLPKFREIVAKTEFTLPPTNKHDQWPQLFTTNKLLKRTPKELFSVNGMKTGYTGPAGYNLVASGINKDGMELISVIMGEKSPNSSNLIYSDSSSLLEYGFKNFSLNKLVETNKPNGSTTVTGSADTGTLELLSDGEISAVLPIDTAEWNLAKKEYIKTEIEAPVEKGAVLGYIEYSRNGIPLGKVNLIASASVEKAPETRLQTTVNAVRNTTDDPLFKRVAFLAAGVLVFFVLLRFILKRISRTRKYKRYKL